MRGHIKPIDKGVVSILRENIILSALDKEEVWDVGVVRNIVDILSILILEQSDHKNFPKIQNYCNQLRAKFDYLESNKVNDSRMGIFTKLKKVVGADFLNKIDFLSKLYNRLRKIFVKNARK